MSSSIQVKVKAGRYIGSEYLEVEYSREVAFESPAELNSIYEKGIDYVRATLDNYITKNAHNIHAAANGTASSAEENPNRTEWREVKSIDVSNVSGSKRIRVKTAGLERFGVPVYDDSLTVEHEGQYDWLYALDYGEHDYIGSNWLAQVEFVSGKAKRVKGLRKDDQ